MSAEGTKDLRPTVNDFGYLNPWDWGGEFATYNSNADNRLYVTVADHTVEKIYLGFKARSNPAYFRVKRPDGTIMSGPHLIPSTSGSVGYINSWAEAAAGPDKFNANGYSAVVVDPDVSGDFYVEINQGSPTIKAAPPPTNGGYTYDFFDITVADTTSNTIKEGRVWAKQWALSTGNQSQFFTAKLYILREDSIRFEVSYNGIDPFGFGIISNSTGVGTSGDFALDRQSISTPKYTQGTVPYTPEHKIFLNEPDTVIYPYPKTTPSIQLANSGSVLVTGCITTGYCINVNTSKPGQTEIKLDLDAVPGFQAGGRDVLVYGIVGIGDNCVPWDGLDGLGDTALSANIEINYKYEAGLIHIPIYDAENHSSGYIFTLMKNSGPTGRDTLKLYWDDSRFNMNPTFGINLSGCQIPCRNWINSYGNERFLNTWSFAFDQTVTLSNVQFDFCPPEVNNDSVSTNENSSVTINPLTNDVAPINMIDRPTFQVTCPPANGTFSILPNQQVVYTPNLGFVGRDTICYTVCDTTTPAACRDGFMFIDVIDINLPPFGGTVNGLPVVNKTSDTLVTPEDTPINICIQWIEFEGQPVTATTSFNTPFNGTLANFADGDSCFTYVPDPNFNGLDTIWVELCDNDTPQACDTVKIPVLVTPVNDPPVLVSGGGVSIVNDTIKVITLNEDTPTSVCFTGTDLDGDDLDVTAVINPPGNGTITNIGTGDSCFTYTPTLNYFGPDTVTISVCDNGTPSICEDITVIFNVLPINDPPVALIDTLRLDPGDVESIYNLGNDFDVETSRSNLTFTITSGPFLAGATAIINMDSIQYSAPAGMYNAIDTVFYSVCDTGAPVLCTPGILLIAIPKSDAPPFALNDTVNTPEDTPKLIPVLVNDGDPNLDPLTVSIITAPQNGNAVVQGDDVLYTPASNFNGLDSLQYEVCDNTSPVPFCDTAWAYVNVTPVNDNPQIVDINGNPLDRTTITINEDDPTQICFDAVEVDPGQTMDVTGVTSFLNNGTASGLSTSDTCFTYTPNLNYHGIDSVLVFVCDNGTPASCDSIVVVINISPINDAPLAVNDTFSTIENVGVTLFPLPNDADVIELTPLDTSSLSILNGPFNGSAVLNANGTISYTPANGFSGKDSIQYEICDSGIPLPGACATAWIIINVDGINDPPLALNDTVITGQNVPITVDVTINDTDPNGNNLTVSIITGPSNGGITLIGSNLTYTPDNGFCGIDTVYYQVCDDGFPSLCDSAYVFFTVTPEDDDSDGLSNVYETLTRNTDGDALNDYLDVDSDNDGISDMVEAMPIGGDLCNPIALDFDGDGVPDYLDPDSDNDGIPDWAERSNGAPVPPTGNDADGDGIDDAYDPDLGGYLETTPFDRDGDGQPDFRDIDSDDDGIPDWIEGSSNPVIPTGNDSDGDGIDDAFDPDNNGSGLYGIPVDTDGDGQPDFRDLDSDGDGIVDFDEKGPNGNNPLDTDGDGLPDFRDLDSDGDGILDVNEDDGDCDEDGIPDYLDPDSCIPSPPTGFSPNNDGVNDTYEIVASQDLASEFPNNRFVIYNRWGNKVYEKAPYDNSWGGESNVDNTIGSEEKLPVGTYFYIFDYGVNGLERITGFIYLKQ